MISVVKKTAIVGAIVASLVPAFAYARKRVKGANARKLATRTRAAARKVAQVAKARKSRAQKRGNHRVK
ncbi:MAG TPA: hypothetical protein VNO55_32820 [Polyangia bacterium]|nr:hypothetical protein [Polyangia bacterium]